MKKENEILERIHEVKENLSDYSRDFIDSYGTDWHYLEDAASEFADSGVDIYYYSLDEYFEEHVQECSDALKEFDYKISDFSDLKDACRKGAEIAQYNEIYNGIMQDEESLEELKELYEELEELKSEEE